MAPSRPDHGNEPGWGSILGLPIPIRRAQWHFWSFCAWVTAFTVVNVTARLVALLAHSPELQWHLIPPLLTIDIIPTAIFCGIFSPIGVETIAMVIAAYYSRRKRRENIEEGRTEGRTEGREEGRAEGREEANIAWRVWNQRRLAAEAVGQTFDEPAPDFDNGAENTENS